MVCSITIGMPFRNAGSTIVDAVRSVFAQTHCEWELLMINDGSTDASVEIARAIRDPRVKVLDDGMHRGRGFRRNQVTELATCEYIAHLDADDLMVPTRLASQYGFLSDHPEFDLMGTGLYAVADDLELVGKRGEQFVSPSADDVLHRRVEIVHASVMAKRSWMKRNPYRDDLVSSEDRELWLRTSRNGDLAIQCIRSPLYFYRESSSLTRRKLLDASSCERRVLRELLPNGTIRRRRIGKMYLKDAAVQGLSAFGATGRLQGRRNQPLEDSERAEAEAVLKQILCVDVPGLQ